jgi:hypothetical protein
MSKISYSLILYAFHDDDEINNFCDPDFENKPVKKLVHNIYKKIEEYDKLGDSSFDDLIVDNEIVGYVFCQKNLLVSFGINKKHRTAEKLQIVFNQIKNKFKGNFESYMWLRNTRAINWLKRCGMTEIDSKINNVIKLQYLCQ